MSAFVRAVFKPLLPVAVEAMRDVYVPSSSSVGVVSGGPARNPIGALNEWAQVGVRRSLRWGQPEGTGPPHSRSWSIELVVHKGDERVYRTGEGETVRAAKTECVDAPTVVSSRRRADSGTTFAGPQSSLAASSASLSRQPPCASVPYATALSLARAELTLFAASSSPLPPPADTFVPSIPSLSFVHPAVHHRYVFDGESCPELASRARFSCSITSSARAFAPPPVRGLSARLLSVCERARAAASRRSSLSCASLCSLTTSTGMAIGTYVHRQEAAAAQGKDEGQVASWMTVRSSSPLSSPRSLS